jgi:hypothetical protein
MKKEAVVTLLLMNQKRPTKVSALNETLYSPCRHSREVCENVMNRAQRKRFISISCKIK